MTIHDPAVQRAAAIARFTELRLAAHFILDRAAKIQGLPYLLQAQGEAAAKIAGTRLHQVHGESSTDDAAAIVTDLQHLWATVDPLIAAIGKQAQACFHGIDESDFTDQLRGALEGNATYALEQAVEDMGADMPSIEANSEHRTHAGRA